MSEVFRCPWAEKPEIYVHYHDTEWGVPIHDDRRLFEFLTLETFQAGLSWLTVLKKREAFRRAFADFDVERVAGYGEAEIALLLSDPGIIRNQAKVRAAVSNARAFLQVAGERGSFSEYLWGWVDGRPQINQWRTLAELPATTPLAERLSADLKRRGFKFVGPTVGYAHMQATGMVNDHLVDCFRYPQLGGAR